jgi:hypothetical protein
MSSSPIALWNSFVYHVPIFQSEANDMIAVHGCPLCMQLIVFEPNGTEFVEYTFVENISGQNPIEIAIDPAFVFNTYVNWTTALSNWSIINRYTVTPGFIGGFQLLLWMRIT